MKRRLCLKAVIKRLGLFLSTFGFAFSIIISISSIASLSSKEKYDCLIADIKANNKNNESHKSFWTVRPIESRRNWLGGDIKPWLYSMTSAWSAFESNNYNYGFLFNVDSNGQTKILNNQNEYMPCGILATPTPSAIKALNLTYSNFDGKNISFNGESGFYISESLYEKINLKETELAIFDENKTHLKFDGIAHPSSNIVFQSLGLKDFIVIPATKAWNMEGYTGQTTYACVIGDDYFQDVYYVTKILFMNEFLDKKNAYLSTFVDDVNDLTTSYENINSNLQQKYEYLVENGGYSFSHKSISLVVIFAILMLSLCIVLIIRKKNTFKCFIKDLPISFLLSLIFYWLFGLTLSSGVRISGIWTLNVQLKTLIAGLILIAVSLCAYFATRFFKKEKTNNFEQDFDEINI